MKIVSIKKVDALFEVMVDGKRIDHIKDYIVTSSADGTTELVLKLIFDSDITEFVMSANQIELTS